MNQTVPPMLRRKPPSGDSKAGREGAKRLRAGTALTREKGGRRGAEAATVEPVGGTAARPAVRDAVAAVTATAL